jgi:hypothetical protein
MGKAVVFIIFAICFVIFILFKYVFVGAKAAYEAVFDPNAKDDRIQRILGNCYTRVVAAMSQRYNGNPDNLRLLIAELVPTIQSYIFDEGYKVPSSVAKAVVCQAIVTANIASEDQVRRATS